MQTSRLEKGFNLFFTYKVKCNKTFEYMIIECSTTIKVLYATATMILFSILMRNDLEVVVDNFCEMATSTMNHTVSLCHTFELTVFHRTLKHVFFLLCRIRVPCLDVILTINLLGETTFTNRTNIRKVICMFLQMIMHR